VVRLTISEEDFEVHRLQERVRGARAGATQSGLSGREGPGQ
jgi:hypothetical protein